MARVAAGLTMTGLAAVMAAQSGRQTSRPAGTNGIDYLKFALGAVPVTIGGAGARLGAGFEQAVRITDGDHTAFVIVNGASATTETEFTYELPAPTTFARFAVPGVTETPSPSSTFTKTVEVHGSAASASSGYTLLASATLETHKARGQITELRIAARLPVRWIRLRLAGGINILRPSSSFEFSELMGFGSQESPQMVTHFSGAWTARASVLTLKQDGPVVSGCYDKAADLRGTVTGNLLRATGLDRSDRTPSAFILSRAADGSLRGVRSTNNSPFRYFTVGVAGPGAKVDCAAPARPTLGCGSIIHGITFGFDSAEIRPESTPVLAALFSGLRVDSSASIVIEGHTSSEGDDDYNLRLSERRAAAVAGDLVRRGLSRDRVRGVGIGERRPIATNTDESGRSMNRRVEVKCN